MKVKSKVIGLLLFLVSSAICIGYGMYTIIRLNVSTNHIVFNDDSTINLRKIIFRYNDKDEVIYKEDGSSLELNDFPSLTTTDGKVITWVDETGYKVFDPYSGSSFDRLIISRDMIISGVADSKITSVNSGIEFNNEKSNNQNVVINQNMELFENTNSTDKTKPSNYLEISGVFKDINIEAKYEENGNQVITNDLSIYENQVHNDNYISIEDPTSVSAINDSTVEKKYKPRTSSNNNVNYCVNRIVLKSDVILLGNSTIKLGAMVGFYGNQPEFSQHEFQGFIIGDYSEIDLNGHFLIIGNGCTVESYGSITNTDDNGNGGVIIENGGTLISSIVVEDYNHETGMPISYGYGDAVFTMYRMPYLNCKVLVKFGGKLKGTLKIDFAGSNSESYYDGVFSVFGNDGESIFQMTDPNSFVLIENSFDNDMKSNFTSNDFVTGNILYQITTINIYNNYSSYFNINFPKFTIDYKFQVVLEYHLTFNIDFYKFSNFISPYFQIKLFNTKLLLTNNVNFLPGSYLYVDKFSTIKLGYTDIRTFEKPEEKILFVTISPKFDSSLYQGIGGLNFISTKYDYAEAKSYYVTDADKLDGTTGFYKIYNGNDNFWSYLNKNKPSKCDMNGKFEFDTSLANNNPNKDVETKYRLGGEINILNEKVFKETINSTTCVDLFNATFKSGPNKGKSGSYLQTIALNITDYFVSPLVSNGNVLMSMSQSNQVRNDYYKNTVSFNSSTGFISDDDGIYAFIFTNNQNNTFNDDCYHLNKTNSGTNLNNFLSTTDSLHGKFFSVTLNDDNSVRCNTVYNSKTNNYNYIYFRGTFLPYDMSNKRVYIDKLRYGEQTTGGSNNDRKVTFIDSDYYGYKSWRIVNG